MSWLSVGKINTDAIVQSSEQTDLRVSINLAAKQRSNEC